MERKIQRAVNALKKAQEKEDRAAVKQLEKEMAAVNLLPKKTPIKKAIPVASKAKKALAKMPTKTKAPAKSQSLAKTVSEKPVDIPDLLVVILEVVAVNWRGRVICPPQRYNQ